LQPGNQYLYPGGDLARTSSMSVSNYDRTIMLFLANGLKGQLESQYAQYILKNIYAEMAWKYLLGLELALAEDLPSRNTTELPKVYWAEGLDWVTSRSGWNSNDVCVSFISADKILGHQHRDQNSVVIFKEGWQAVDASTYSASGIIQSTDTHNTIIVDGWGQRYGVGTGDVLKYKATDEYTYVVGDATDAYYGGEIGNKDRGDPHLLTMFQRELVHIQPDFVVVFDRITPVSASSEIKYLIHSHDQPTVQGDLITSTEGGGKMFHKTLLPQNFTMSVVGENYGRNGARSSYRVEIKPQTPTANHINLNVVYVGPSSASAMPTSELFSTDTDNMVGTKLDVGGTDVILLFTKDPAGAAPQGSVIYEIGRATQTEHYLMDLKVATRYSVETVANGETLTVIVTEGEGPITSNEGILSFTTGGATPKVALTKKRN